LAGNSYSTPFVLGKVRHTPVRYGRWIVVVCVITGRAWSTRRRAITCAIAEPRAIWVGFADPPAVVATCAEPHLKRLLVPHQMETPAGEGDARSAGVAGR
jgi:hypothetical protein